MTSIRSLPPNVAVQLTSSVSTLSLDDAILGTIKNSLDAGSKRIDVDVDFARGSFTIEDDGDGIPAPEFGADGNLGRPFHTSRFRSPAPCHGYSGSFLASLSGVSLLSILSRQRGEQCSHNVMFYQAQRILSDGQERSSHYLRSRNHGTRVSVRDIFGNMPVRVKQRPVGEQGKSRRDKDWRMLCHESLALLLACECNVFLNLKGQDNDHSFRLKPYAPAASQNILSGGFNAGRYLHLLQQSPGTEESESSSWVQTTARGSHFIIQGLISKHPRPTREVQQISLGIHALPKKDEWQELYDTVNATFSASSFGVQTHTEKSTEKTEENSQVAYRNPAFYVRIEFENRIDKNTLRPRDLGNRARYEIIDMLEAMAVGFLKKQGCRPRARRDRGAHAGALEPSCPPDGKGISANEFRNCDRMKQGSFAHVTKSTTDYDPSPQSHPSSSKSEFSMIDEIDAIAVSEAMEGIISPVEDDFATMIHPKTGEKLGFNTRTDAVESNFSSVNSANKPFGAKTSKPRMTLRFQSESFPENQAMQDWASDKIKSWENPVFESAEVPIPAIDAGVFSLNSLPGASPDFAIAFKQYHLTHRETRITIQDLQNATAIGQIDRKFILASTERGEPMEKALFVVDQHAADERIRVEALLRELCPSDPIEQSTPQDGFRRRTASLNLEQIISFSLNAGDIDVLEQSASYFAAWGVFYTLNTNGWDETRTRTGNSRYATLEVHGLPALVAERCRADKSLLRGLILNGAYARREHGAASRSSRAHETDCGIVSKTVADANREWLARIHDCPAGLLEMINSRSCRSAIMFNDILTLEQCQDLLDGLGNCVLPFQCAHGRPSIVPLAALSMVHATSDAREASLPFEQAYRDWSGH